MQGSNFGALLGPPVTAALVVAGGWPAAAWLTSVALQGSRWPWPVSSCTGAKGVGSAYDLPSTSSPTRSVPGATSASGRFERALAQSGRTDAWPWPGGPSSSIPDMPLEGMTRDDYVRAKFGGGDRPRQIYQAIAESGREAGIEFQFSRIRRTPNTVLSHRLVHWSAKNDLQDEVVAELFKAYFEQGLDIGDLEILVECARRAGIDELRARRHLMSEEGRQEVVASDVYARRLGINGVPCFIVNRKYAVSGAQPPSAFVEVFNLAERDAATSAAQSTA